MAVRQLLDLGLTAYERGFLERERLVEALGELTKPDAVAIAPEVFWARYGMTPEQIEQIALAPHTLSTANPEGISIQIASSALRESRPTLVDEARSTLVDPVEQGGLMTERFKTIGVLGVGGMGEVLEVEDARIGRRVAVKRVKASVPQPERAAALLEREARVTGRLEHPNIVPLYDLGTEDARGPYYVMRLLTHPTLAQVLQQVRKRDPNALAAYSLHRLIRCFVQVCRAVDYAHSRGVIHCDLKPANILVGPFGEVLVVDWGFCHILGERRAQRGGTPGFLAPEQLAPESAVLDARTDVFALGAVLYDILCLQHAFPILPMAFMVEAVRKGQNPLPPPTPPSIRAPERRIDAELDEICLRALSFSPDQRYPSACDLANALDAYLEGVGQLERRGQRARELTEQGDLLADNYRDLEQQAPERASELGRLRASVASWSSAADKQALWDAEDREEVLQSVARRTFQAAVASYEHALDEVPTHAPARLGLARIYWEALQRAQDRRADAERLYLEGLVNQYDDGVLQRPARTVGGVLLRADGPVTGGTLVRTSLVGRRLVPVREQRFSGHELTAQGLDPGSYLVHMDTPYGQVTVPLLLRSGSDLELSLDVSSVARRSPGEVLVPGGEALLGGHETSLLGDVLCRVDVPTFLLDTLPVTFRRYLAFLDGLGDPSQVERWLPRSEGGEPYFERAPDGWRPRRARRWGHDLLGLPVFGVDLDGALAYARWLADRTGLGYRLPTEHEWEKAARGVDGRIYPWGDHFDASFCKMRESRPGTPAPEEPGAFAADVSVYGVHDLAGGVAEWAVPPFASERGGQVASRGGAWCDWRSDCHVAARRPYTPNERAERVGFRLARSVE